MTDIHSIEWGGSGIEKVVFEHICELIPEGATVLELGSGNVSTPAFATKFRVISIEQDARYLGLHNSHYFHAPLDGGWFSLKVLKSFLKTIKYDLIFVDAPTGEGNRWGFLNNIDLFNTEVPIVIHDTYREEERNLLLAVSEKINKPYELFSKGGDHWGVIK